MADKAPEEVAFYENRFAAANVRFETCDGKILLLLQITTTMTLGIVISIAVELLLH